ncbi:holo-[acyl-carrier protein] synthase [Desulfonatronum thiosulfatophilum]|uniref:Holo-[acyl-carrier-protein] synthase n=1 Tax=Desulfonatronum thiosulfatophilum TaxID=617002 RepID=A0A1G6DDQ8_9BACT|nr:holo-[acyl-carrier-protein] synthase [Desulfonatronum thiosulfatophilum]SDB42975.1 holo-[acyl-carrier protein] synthase [Desulfonatronum thiosulfatophilum]
MAILGLGLDVVELERIRRIWNRFGQGFARRILTECELLHLPNQAVPYLASRFAAKEAAVKALGTGFSQGITFQQVEVVTLPTGQPTLVLHANAEIQARCLGSTRTHVSLTHGRDTAAAVVILES